MRISWIVLISAATVCSTPEKLFAGTSSFASRVKDYQQKIQNILVQLHEKEILNNSGDVRCSAISDNPKDPLLCDGVLYLDGIRIDETRCILKHPRVCIGSAKPSGLMKCSETRAGKMSCTVTSPTSNLTCSAEILEEDWTMILTSFECEDENAETKCPIVHANAEDPMKETWVLQSPLYPLGYPAKSSCVATISSDTAVNGFKVLLRKLDIPVLDEKDCDEGSLTIVSRSARAGPVRGIKVCGKKWLRTYKIRGPKIHVRFDSILAGDGFQAIIKPY